MTMWKNNLQKASYKNVAFDVISISDKNEKALVRHGRPFANGTDIEDLGTQGRQCQIAAVYFGAGFDTKLSQLLAVLEEPGAGTLVHPVLGLLQNMIAASWSFRTEADSVNYVALDITFFEAKESVPIFLFENQWLAKLEQIHNTLEKYTQQLLGYSETLLSVREGISSIWGSTNGVFAALCGVAGSVRRFFDLDPIKYLTSKAFSSASYNQDVSKLIHSVAVMVTTGLTNDAQFATGSLSSRQTFDSISNRVDSLNNLPDYVLHSQDIQESEEAINHVQKIAGIQMQPIAQILQIISIGALIQNTVTIIEVNSDIVTANELLYINNNLRLRIQKLIDILRETYDYADNVKSINAANIYTQTTIMVQMLANIAAQFNDYILAVINQKPPIRTRKADISGTIHQLAYLLYQDIKRANELMRLNPHLCHPSFIQRNEWINYYVK
ncbi:MAG: DNA circularization protein [Snodgrassella sp.]|uniref:DNA circularization protein n=1 Tax=Snodgrassella sp. TaxID=2815304 RepID=UPI002586EF42|nr:DNA circularization N-terminal domain-containing protein [Snodgrassella sp.]MCO6512846.1 DNA circularization protein [Snodgrassella sp.]MCO6516119.1 DNA circularization protein [Snodgrassella sp.]